jgi:hypothetical protein
MDKRTKLIIILSAVAVALSATGIVMWLVLREPAEPEMQVAQGASTNELVYFEDDTPPADPMMVGKWRNQANAGWYKVYYDDYDGDGFYWGKEWDESDDVFEEDLRYHGNGWFRWRKNGKELLEMATMDERDVPIAKTYIIATNSADSLIYKDASRKKTFYRFGRVQ